MTYPTMLHSAPLTVAQLFTHLQADTHTLMVNKWTEHYDLKYLKRKYLTNTAGHIFFKGIKGLKKK